MNKTVFDDDRLQAIKKEAIESLATKQVLVLTPAEALAWIERTEAAEKEERQRGILVGRVQMREEAAKMAEKHSHGDFIFDGMTAGIIAGSIRDIPLERKP